MPSPLIRVIKSLFLPDRREGDIFTNVNFLLKCKYSLQKKNRLCPVFRAFPASAGSQWPLGQNNLYAQEAYIEMASSLERPPPCLLPVSSL